jgi:hypothetical protein
MKKFMRRLVQFVKWPQVGAFRYNPWTRKWKYVPIGSDVTHQFVGPVGVPLPEWATDEERRRAWTF